uniref:Uncharacterized protein n=1 Tax=Lactuca sativa TaxID=4236 RepID=A0A9R1XLA2_LACSA|nr:hypothetical protein LSAT_V11C400164450 [Lactuca sativa]
MKGEPPLDGSIIKGTLESSQPSSPWFHGESHSTGSSALSSFTSTLSVEFKHETVEGEPPILGSSGLFQDDLFEGTFNYDYPDRPKEQYEIETLLTKWTNDHPIEQIIVDLDSGQVTRSTTKNECLYESFLSVIEPKAIKEAL